MLGILTSWTSPSPSPSRPPPAHVGATDEDMAYVSALSSLPRARRCHRGHLVAGANAYTRANGRLECRRCRADASKRYRDRQRKL
jgi:hypothetical protein